MARAISQPPKKKASDALLAKSGDKMKLERKSRKDKKKQKKPHRWKPGTVVNREIKKQQSGQGKGIEKSTFERVVKGIAAEVTEKLLSKAKKDGGETGMIEILSEHPFQTGLQGTNYSEIKRWSAEAKSTLLQATEEYLTEMFIRTKKSLTHRGAEKMKIQPIDLKFAVHMMSPEFAKTPVLDKEDMDKARKKEERRKKREKKDEKNKREEDGDEEKEDAPSPNDEENVKEEGEIDEDAYLSA